MTSLQSAGGGDAAGNTAGRPPVLLGIDPVAKYAGVSVRHWRRLVDAGKAPQPVRLAGRVLWNRHVVDSWIADGCPTVRRVKGGAR